LKKRTLILKLLFTTITLFIITLITITIIADRRLKKITDNSQYYIFNDKLNDILHILEKQANRLKATGNIKAYEKDFQMSVLKTLKQIYYETGSQQVYPIIINYYGEIIMHPEFNYGSKELKNESYIKKAVTLKDGNFNYKYKTGEKKWCIIRTFNDWSWIVGYTIPFKIKYKDVILFRNIFILIELLSVLILSIIVTIFIKRMMKPIEQLTDASIAISSNNLDYKINIQRDDELGILAENFIKMRDSIKDKINDLAKKNKKLLKEINDRKKTEKEKENLLKQLKSKNEELESIVYVSSHDLRSPLVNIMGYSKELKYSLDDIKKIINKIKSKKMEKKDLLYNINNDIDNSIKFITDSANKIDILLKGLLKVSRIGHQEINIKKINTNQLFEEIINSLSYKINTSKAEITIEKLPDCYSDYNLLSQIFTNLLDNAIKYLNPGKKGKIHISGKIINGKNIYCIEDNGIGIIKNCNEKIFNIFYRIHPNNSIPGDGLGLTIVRRILDRLNGEVWFVSNKGSGTKFYIALSNNSNYINN